MSALEIGSLEPFGKLWRDLDLFDDESSSCNGIQAPTRPVEEHFEDRESWKRLEKTEVKEVCGKDIGDIPAKYTVGGLRKEELLAIGIYVDPRIVPGFKYRVRRLYQAGGRERWLWAGEALELESVGRGYSRRLTFAPPHGSLNDNPHYFWADSSPWGFALQLELVSPGDEFTVYDSSQVPVATLRVVQNQEVQSEVGQRTLEDGSLEKTARVKALVEVEWYSQDLAHPATNTLPMTGRAVGVKKRGGGVVIKAVNATLGGRSYTLCPGSTLRPTHVRGDTISDVPTTYTILGLEPHQLPVIGTYVDPRIAVGFYYKVSRAGGERRRKWVWKDAVKLVSIGKGYGKRMIFSNGQSSEQLHLWSDSHPDGLGLEHAAVRAGFRFAIYSGDLKLGSARVFRADAPQIEKKQYLADEGLVKEVHVELTCTVLLDSASSSDTMRVSGTAVLLKKAGSDSAQLLRLEDIGLESQLNLFFLTQAQGLLFLPF